MQCKHKKKENTFAGSKKKKEVGIYKEQFLVGKGITLRVTIVQSSPCSRIAGDVENAMRVIRKCPPLIVRVSFVFALPCCWHVLF